MTAHAPPSGAGPRVLTPLDHHQFRAAQRFPALDGVRAMAAIAVVLFHFGGPSFAWASGWLGVHVFFVLSGFLITSLALREHDRFSRVSLRNFYVRRIFRIWPAYLAVLGTLVVLFVLRGEFGARGMGRALPWYLSFNSELWPANTLFGHTWTIGIEQKFYLFWPLLAFLPWVRGFRRRLVVVAAVLSLGAALWSAAPGMVVHYMVIAIGCLVAVLMHHRRSFSAVAVLARPLPALGCWAAFGAYQLAVPRLVHAAGSEPPVVLGYGLLMGSLMPSLVALPALSRLLGGRVMGWWGERSYSIYLVQLLVSWALALLVPAFNTRRLLTGLAVVAGSALVADLLYRNVERPCMVLGRRFTRRASRPAPHPGLDRLSGERPVVVRTPVASAAGDPPVREGGALVPATAALSSRNRPDSLIP